MDEYDFLLETERLWIRKFRTDDLENLYNICSDKILMKYVGNGEPLSLEQVHKWLSITEDNYDTKGYGNYALIYKENKELIGYGGLVYSKEIDKTELIYTLKKEFWNLGLATEASAKIIDFGLYSVKLNEIYASIDPENIASENVLIKLGFHLAFKQNDEFGYPTWYYKISGDDDRN